MPQGTTLSSREENKLSNSEFRESVFIKQCICHETFNRVFLKRLQTNILNKEQCDKHKESLFYWDSLVWTFWIILGRKWKREFKFLASNKIGADKWKRQKVNLPCIDGRSGLSRCTAWSSAFLERTKLVNERYRSVLCT